MKNHFLMVGLSWSVVCQFLPHLTPQTWTLIVFMTLDFVTAIVNAVVFGTSTKTTTGGLESRAMLKGLVRKVYIIFLCAISYSCDYLLSTNYIYNTVVVAMIVNELVSLLENIAVSGLQTPEVLNKFLEVIKNE